MTLAASGPGPPGGGRHRLGVATVHGRPKPTGGRVWVLISLMAVTNASIGFAAMFVGVNGLATGTAAVFTNAQLPLVLLPAWWLYREWVTRPVPRTVISSYFVLGLPKKS